MEERVGTILNQMVINLVDLLAFEEGLPVQNENGASLGRPKAGFLAPAEAAELAEAGLWGA